MKLYVILLAGLAAASVDVDAESAAARCKPATYRCDPHRNGWNVCNTSGEWVIGGKCPWRTVCWFDRRNGSPYCIPPGGKEASDL
ncbi:hypothetical protein CRV24_000088 [Beauveria bassiana]|uniref:Uncharacterized protein n=1 Tax=Beauveria bassiana (strain ARSEF 2860) TaxID=655819 RepID=J4UFA8_BEAB2|nr:uncharacterized protein BBA_09884 [Beauveria bassiana ARSEF 2860]EJP61182.1 hypothetical protein BBA_09884 [Beauveria bassiana ARSEF 2860]KAF1738166.1 hypothetical protein CRV24_000088 [Beauveria bassiana]KAH8721396.1 hypothetical protein HC256_001754 [Beauveria bassiana]